MSERGLRIVEAGLLTTVQDLGRPGYAHLGVPRSGCVDEPALRLANRLVGNPEGAAVLETTATGVSFTVTASMCVAVTGAPAPMRVAGRPVPWGEPVPVRAGAKLEVGPAWAGLRSVVAVAGGASVPSVLGSRSTDLLSGLGPAALSEGCFVPVGPPVGEPRPTDVVAVRRPAPPYVLELVAGPREDWFDPRELARLAERTWTVSGNSNRVGVRLDGVPLARTHEGELASEPMVLGAVQVPPSGLPVLLLNDHATTGGYPVVGVVRRADLPVCAQLRPGDEVVLRLSRACEG